jgi:hypothetical protein
MAQSLSYQPAPLLPREAFFHSSLPSRGPGARPFLGQQFGLGRFFFLKLLRCCNGTASQSLIDR